MFGKNKYKKLVLDNFWNMCNAIIMVFHSENSYEVILADEQFQTLVQPSGKLEQLYHSILFRRRVEGRIEDEAYSDFTNMDLFSAENYRGDIEIKVKEGMLHYEFRILKISETVNVIYFTENNSTQQYAKKEEVKIAAIREQYLFSMVVDLLEDSCKNSIIGEFSSDRQDYLDMPYSKWRVMISEMFEEEDKKLFLHISDPVYLEDYLLRNQQLLHEIKMRNLMGELIWVRLSFTRTENFSKQHPVFVYAVRDINDDMLRLLYQENIISEVKKQNQRLEKESQNKSLFISSMSHEFRSPLNAILGMSDVIAKESQSKEIQEYTNIIKNAGKMLLQTVNDLLDYNKLIAGNLVVVKEPYSPMEVCKEVLAMVKEAAEEKHLSLVLEGDENLPVYLLGDEVRLKQVLLNLLNNAVKYTDHGRVVLQISYDKKVESRGNLFVAVKDTGRGIKEEDMERVLERYVRLDESDGIEGTGLGLSLVSDMLEKMDSKLEVKSKEGCGSTFFFELNQDWIEPEEVEETSADWRSFPWKNYRVLVVDDTKTNRIVARSLLVANSVNADFAESSEVALEMIKNQKYDIIFLDYMMPKMNGGELLREIRSMGADYQNIPIIALTANVISNAKQKYMELGFDDFLEKPIEEEKLFLLMMRVLQKTTA